MSFRRAGRMHHLGVGASNAHRRVTIAIADQTSVTVIDLSTGEVLSTHTIDPNRTYWRNQQKRPGRWPGRIPMTRLICRTMTRLITGWSLGDSNP